MTNNMDSGFLLIHKPSGPTSHDIIDQLRRITGIKKIGHAGTLDPFASGLLIVAVGRESTKRLGEFVGLDKGYEAILQFGAVSDTYDRDGKIEIINDQFSISKKDIERTLEKFRGEIRQIPPMFSAKKVKGKKLYELAREGKVVEREPSNITIYELACVDYDLEKKQLVISCRVSSGTYIRTLGHNIGEKLQVGAYVQELKRTSVGEYKLENATGIEDVTSVSWRKLLKEL